MGPLSFVRARTASPPPENWPGWSFSLACSVTPTAMEVGMGGRGVKEKGTSQTKGVIYFNLERQNWEGCLLLQNLNSFRNDCDCSFLCSGWLGAGFTQHKAWATPS